MCTHARHLYSFWLSGANPISSTRLMPWKRALASTYGLEQRRKEGGSEGGREGGREEVGIRGFYEWFIEVEEVCVYIIMYMIKRVRT